MAEPKRTQAAAELRDVELMRPGTYMLASGEQTFTVDMMRDAARYAARSAARPAPLKIGHSDPRFTGDGEPAMGWLGNIRYLEDDDGPVLVGDVTGMPDWLAAAAPHAWPDRSVEGWTDFEDDGDTYAFVIDGLALLGVTPPGISSIRSLRDLPAALGVAASARIVARMGAPTVRPSQTPATEAEQQRGAGMDPAKIREALGLNADASDDEVKAAVVAAGLVASSPGQPTDPDPTNPPDPADPNPAPPVKPELVNAAGVMRVDASAWEEREQRIKRLEAQAARQRDGERDQIIAKAVQDGKFPPARREHWVRLWNADPEGARQVIDGLAKNVMPVMASGYTGSDEDGEDVDAEFAHLFPAERTASKGGVSRG